MKNEDLIRTLSDRDPQKEVCVYQEEHDNQCDIRQVTEDGNKIWIEVA